MILSGTRTASVSVTFRRAVTFHDGDPDEGRAGPSIAGSADVAGYLLTNVARTRLIAGVLTTTRLRPAGAPARFAVGGDTVRVPAGRYALTLVASAQTEVHVPVDGLAADARYRPTATVPLKVVDQALDPVLGIKGEGAAAINLTAGTVTLLGVAFTTTAQDGNGAFCITVHSHSCPGLVGSEFAYATNGAPQPMQDQAFAMLVNPDPRRKGGYDAAWSVSLNGLYTAARGVAITVG